MSDFSEICPIFETGVFHEVSFYNICRTTGTSFTSNLLESSLTAGTAANGFSFGRTVVVTDAFLKRYVNATAPTNDPEMIMRLRHRSTAGATPTNFALITISVTVDVQHPLCYNAMTVSTSTTFTSDAVLDFNHATETTTFTGNYDLMVRYREA
ncbi:hypothetical protein [Neptuniibacter sp.]|uniref:hypothetical protein n=1 Tax=Neptuniibacter sp. TaxID=1962643 RepID=UPI002627FCC6|nr:hypothetical protein [Neptuniibacter sp.]MCP4597065.1 hypothetical protein [Neptuniibacter sp.]